jgi:hypothetical protein
MFRALFACMADMASLMKLSVWLLGGTFHIAEVVSLQQSHVPRGSLSLCGVERLPGFAPKFFIRLVVVVESMLENIW